MSTVQECETGKIRLVGGATNSSGILEVCVDGIWGKVCNYFGYWGPNNARVVCRQLGFSENSKISWLMMILPYFANIFQMLFLWMMRSYLEKPLELL